MKKDPNMKTLYVKIGNIIGMTVYDKLQYFNLTTNKILLSSMDLEGIIEHVNNVKIEILTEEEFENIYNQHKEKITLINSNTHLS